MYLQDTRYHGALRVSSLVLAFVLLFDSGILNPATRTLSENAQDYVANVVGVSASVQETELNLITAALTEKEKSLNEREQQLVEREIALERSDLISPTSDVSTFILSLLLFILLALILLNYGLDFARYRKQLEVVST